jgi:hypothetical protein
VNIGILSGHGDSRLVQPELSLNGFGAQRPSAIGELRTSSCAALDQVEHACFCAGLAAQSRAIATRHIGVKQNATLSGGYSASPNRFQCYGTLLARMMQRGSCGSALIGIPARVPVLQGPSYDADAGETGRMPGLRSSCRPFSRSCRRG